MTAPTTDPAEPDTAPEDAPETPDDPAQVEAPPADDDPTEEPDDGGADPGKEAARYRRRLRDTEGERDTLSGRLERMQRREVERLATDRLAVPADVLTYGGTDLADLLDDAGDVDPARVQAAVAATLEQRPGLARPVPRRMPDFGGGQRGEPIDTGTTWAEALKGGKA